MTKRAASGTSAAVGGLWDRCVPSDETLVRWQALVDGIDEDTALNIMILAWQNKRWNR